MASSLKKSTSRSVSPAGSPRKSVRFADEKKPTFEDDDDESWARTATPEKRRDSADSLDLFTEAERSEVFGSSEDTNKNASTSPGAGGLDPNALQADGEGDKEDSPPKFFKKMPTAEEIAATQSDANNDLQVMLPFVPQHETTGVPTLLAPPPPPAEARAIDASLKQRAVPNRLAGSGLKGEPWHPGMELIIANITWNMAQNTPDATQIQSLVRPNAHIIAINTQENGPYVGSNTSHMEWMQIMDFDCLGSKYSRIAEQTLWAVHIAVYVRVQDVLPYVKHVETSYVKTGSAKNILGNKGGVGVGLTISLRPNDVFDMYHGVTTEPEKKTALQLEFEKMDQMKKEKAKREAEKARGAEEDQVGLSPRGPRPQQQTSQGKDGVASSSETTAAATKVDDDPLTASRKRIIEEKFKGVRNSASSTVTLLFIGSHLTAHQHNIKRRNADFLRIVAEMKLGCRGARKRRFKRSNGGQSGRLAKPDPSAVDVKERRSPTSEGNSDSGRRSPIMPPQPAPPAQNGDESSPRGGPRDVTEEYDAAFFMGDLNYRINGTKRGIENIIENHLALRAVLVQNDQLRREMDKGFVFPRFNEGLLNFRPTYKFEIDKRTKMATDEYDRSKKARMPAYCDRVLFKRHMGYPYPLNLSLYTDVPGVRTSDHRPVVAMFTLGTALYEGDDESDDEVEESSTCCC